MNIIVEGSHGEAIFDSVTGQRIGGDGYHYLARIDLSTTKGKTHVDVLHVAFWTPQGEYVEPRIQERDPEQT